MTISLRFGAIVKIRQFGFTDQQGAKTAPAVVLSTARFHDQYKSVIVARVTSKLQHRDKFGAVAIRDHAVCGLSKPSLIKPIVMTVEIDQVLGVAGFLDDRTLNDLKRSFRSVFAFVS